MGNEAASKEAIAHRASSWPRGASASSSMNPCHQGATTLLLNQAMLCLDCEVVFREMAASCPRCASRQWVPLARFLNREKPELGRTIQSAPARGTASNGGTPHMTVVTGDEYARFVRAQMDDSATNLAAESRTAVQIVKAGVVIAQAIYVAGRDPEYQVSQ
jgi:hypothetical protein